jgi:hypothetical protein
MEAMVKSQELAKNEEAIKARVKHAANVKEWRAKHKPKKTPLKTVLQKAITG